MDGSPPGRHPFRPGIQLWTLYDHPSDFPDAFIARRFEVGSGWQRATEEVIQTADVAYLHVWFRNRGFIWMGRAPDDDPVILGVYMR